MNRAIVPNALLIAALGVGALSCASASGPAKSYCGVVAKQQGSIFLPVYPPQQGLAAGALLELHLKKGWDTPLGQCVPYTERRLGDVATSRRVRAVIPTFSAHIDSSGVVNLGKEASFQVPLGAFARAGVAVDRKVEVSFGDLEKVDKPGVGQNLVVFNGAGQKLNERLYPQTEYLNREGPFRSKPFSIWLLVAEEVYLAGRIAFIVSVRAGGQIGGGSESLLQELNATGEANWNRERGVYIAEKSFDPPLAIGVEGLLAEVDSRTGRVIRWKHYP